MPHTDPQLLSRYVNADDQSAFTELVTRYLPLVRGMLWRRTGDRQTVDELAMQVFATVAQNATKLQNRSTIGGWLVITSRQKASEALRNDFTRRKYMEQFAAETTSDSDSDFVPVEEATHYLDDALAELQERDRQAVLLRFYEKLSYREIARQLGRKEDATRKRVNRSLEHMASFLRRRGVTLSATTLAGGLTAQLTCPPAQASGPGIAASVLAKQSLTLAANTATESTIATLSFTNWILAGTAVFLLSTGVGFVGARQSKALPVARPTTTGASPSLLTLNSTTQNAAPSLHEAVAPYLKTPVNERIRRAADLWELSRRRLSPTAGLEYKTIMKSFLPEECVEALAVLDRDFTYNNERHWRMARELFNAMVRADQSRAAKYALEKLRAGIPFWDSQRLRHAVGSWAEVAPNDVLAWMESEDLSSGLRHDLSSELIRGTSHNDPKAALEMAFELPWEQRRNVIDMVDSMENPELREDLLTNTAAILSEFERAEVFQAVVLGAIKDTDEIEKIYARMRFTRSDAVVPLMDRIIDFQLRNNKSNRPALFDFAIGNLPDAALPHLLDRHIRKWLKSDSAAASKWLARHDMAPADVAAASASFAR